MIEFINLKTELPYLIFKDKYDEAMDAKQQNIEAISISSYNNVKHEVDSRYVNLKFINDNKFIFFSNYDSPKSFSFESHNQISALFYWSSINVQIRMKANINKTSVEYNNEYFKKRAIEKNALAISSNQSKCASSYEEVVSNYHEIKNNYDLTKCPNYWGGFSFIPYYFEFWEGHESRVNKRQVFEKINADWNQSILQP